MRILALALAPAVMVWAADRGQVSRGIEQRTGHGLSPTPSKTLALPPGLTVAGALSEDDAVAIALWNSSALEADLTALGLARADLLEAGLLRNPNLSMLLPVGPKPFELALTLPLETFWQRPRRVAAARVQAEQVGESLVQHGLDLARDVRLAHADLVLAQARLAIAGDAARLREEIAALSRKRLEAGDIGELEAETTRLDALTAAEQMARLLGERNVAGERLRSLLRLRPDQAAAVVAVATVTRSAPAPATELVEAGFASRPDLRAAELAVQAAARRAGWERSRLLTLGPMLSSKGVGTHGVRTGPGVSLDVPVFHRNQGAISRAEAEVEAAARRYVALRDQVEHEVLQSRIRLVQALDLLGRLEGELLGSVRQSIALAEKAHAAGDISYLAVLEATRPLHEVRQREAEAAAEARRAWAEIERAAGKRIP